MVFGNITQLFTPNRYGASTQHIPTGSSSPDVGTSSPASFSFGNGGRKNGGLRHSASLQDFSSYHAFDPEEARETNSNWGQNGASFSKDKGGLPPSVPKPSTSRRKWIRAVMIVTCLFLFASLVYILGMYVYTNWSRGASRYYVVLTAEARGLVPTSTRRL